MIKVLMKLGIEGMYLNIIKTIYIASLYYSQHHNKWGKAEIISSKVKNEVRVFPLSTLNQFNHRIPNQSNTLTGRRNIRNTNWKGSSQTTFIYR
jgi:hypothetical protein